MPASGGIHASRIQECSQAVFARHDNVIPVSGYGLRNSWIPRTYYGALSRQVRLPHCTTVKVPSLVRRKDMRNSPSVDDAAWMPRSDPGTSESDGAGRTAGVAGLATCSTRAFRKE